MPPSKNTRVSLPSATALIATTMFLVMCQFGQTYGGPLHGDPNYLPESSYHDPTGHPENSPHFSPPYMYAPSFMASQEVSHTVPTTLDHQGKNTRVNGLLKRGNNFFTSTTERIKTNPHVISTIAKDLTEKITKGAERLKQKAMNFRDGRSGNQDMLPVSMPYPVPPAGYTNLPLTPSRYGDFSVSQGYQQEYPPQGMGLEHPVPPPPHGGKHGSPVTHSEYDI